MFKGRAMFASPFCFSLLQLERCREARGDVVSEKVWPERFPPPLWPFPE